MRRLREAFGHQSRVHVVLDKPIEQLGARKVAFDLSPILSQARLREYSVYGYPSKPAELFDGGNASDRLRFNLPASFFCIRSTRGLWIRSRQG